MVSDLLTDPDAFFARQSADLRFAPPLLVVAAAGTLTVLSGAPGARTLVAAGGTPPPWSTVLLAVLIGGVIGGVAAWTLTAAVMHVVSALFGGRGRFGRTLFLAGWGYVPLVFSGGLSTAASFYAAGGTAPAAGFVGAASTALGVLFVCWQGVLWTFAIKHARDVRTRAAAVAAAVPVLASVSLLVLSLL